MRVKTAHCSSLQPARSSCQASIVPFDIVPFDLNFTEHHKGDNFSFGDNYNPKIIPISNAIKNAQTGASTLVLALFIATILVTVTVGLIFGHKIGYQSGYHTLKAETQQAMDSGQMSSEELKELRLSQKVLSNQVATAKQELTISLNNLDELRESQRELDIENRQVGQLNELYAQVISDKGGMPLQILGAKITPLPENAFEYGFDVGLLSKSGQSKNLNVTLTLLNDDDFVEVPLDPARYSIKGIIRIRGRFVMPANFKPLQAKLVLEADGQEVEQLYDWTLGEMVDSMPLSLVDLPEVDQSPIQP